MLSLSDDLSLLELAALGVGAYLVYKYVYLPYKAMGGYSGAVNALTTNANAGVQEHILSQLNSIQSFPDGVTIWGTGQTAGELKTLGYTDADLKQIMINYANQNAPSNSMWDAWVALFGGAPTYTSDVSNQISPTDWTDSSTPAVTGAYVSGSSI